MSSSPNSNTVIKKPGMSSDVTNNQTSIRSLYPNILRIYWKHRCFDIPQYAANRQCIPSPPSWWATHIPQSGNTASTSDSRPPSPLPPKQKFQADPYPNCRHTTILTHVTRPPTHTRRI